jgi:hypothetical protein
VRSACLGLALFAVLPPPAASPDSAPLESRVLDLAFVGSDRLAVLLEDGVALYRLDGKSLRRTDHRAIPAGAVVRAPAGVVVAETDAFWVGTNTAEGAVLFTADGGRLRETERAAALPFAGSPLGALFRAGTNLIEVTVAGLGGGPHLRAVGGENPWAIAPDGRLGSADGWTRTRVGSAAARLWPGTWIASSTAPPGSGDTLSVTRGDGAPPPVVATFPAPAAVTAIGAHVAGDRALVAVALAEGDRHRLVLMEVSRDRP